MGGSTRRPPPPQPGCIDLEFTAPLQAADVDVLQGLSEGKFLQIRLSETNSAQSVEAQTNEGKVAGIVLETNARKLRTCLAKGFLYQAEILELDGAFCSLHIWCTGKND